MAGGSRNRGGPKVGFPEGAAALHPSPRSARGPAAECPYTLGITEIDSEELTEAAFTVNVAES